MRYEELNEACKVITDKFLDEYGAVTLLSKALDVSYHVIERAKNGKHKNSVLFSYIRYVVKVKDDA